VVFIRDLNSRNGTYVDGERVTRCVLLSGKSLRIADITFEVITSQSTVRSNAYRPRQRHHRRARNPLGSDQHQTSGPVDGQRQVLRLLVRGLRRKDVAVASASVITRFMPM